MTWHAKMSASASSRWLECPGSVQLAERMPDDDVSLPSATGTAAHQLAEECLKTGRYPARYKGKRYHVDGFDIEVDDAMVYGVTLYVKYCNLLHSPGDMRWIELDVTKWMTTLHPWFGGTADFVTYDQELRLLSVVDYKNGSGVYVGVEENPQLMYYALGAYRMLRNSSHPPEHICVHVVQPNYGDDDPIREWQVPLERLREFQQEIVDAAAAAELDTPPLKAGDHCKFCPAKLHCPELQQHTQLVQAREFEILPALSDVQLGRAMSILDAVEARCKAIRAEAYKRLMRGDKVPGQKLVEKQARRHWTNEVEVVARATNDPEVVTEDIYQAPKLKSVAQLEKLVGKKAFAERYGDLTDSRSSGYNVVSDGDARAPASPTQASPDEFDNI